MASREKEAAHPYEDTPEAWATKTPAAIIEIAQTNRKAFRRVIFILVIKIQFFY